MDCIYVFISLMYASLGLTYGYLIWRFLEVLDAYAHGMDA